MWKCQLSASTVRFPLWFRGWLNALAWFSLTTGTAANDPHHGIVLVSSCISSSAISTFSSINPKSLE